MLLLASVGVASAQGTAFTFQGRLNDETRPATGIYDLRFTIYDVAASGSAVGAMITNTATPVSNGLFSVRLDFGSGVFTGGARWLEMAARTNGSADAFELMLPRNELTPAPYALYAPSAGTASAMPASGLTGTVSLAQLPTTVLTNGASAVSLTGSFTGNGAGLTNLDATRLMGTVADARLSANVALLNTNQVFIGSNRFAGVLALTNAANTVAGAFTGNGGGLSNLNASQISSGTLSVSQLPAAVLTNGASAVSLTGSFTGNGAGLTNLDATRLTGTIADARLSANVALLNTNQVFTGSNRFAGVLMLTNAANTVAGAFTGDGGGLTNLNAAHMTGLPLPAGMTVVSMAANDPALVTNGYRPMMTIPAPAWVNGSTTSAPSARIGHTAVWDGQRLLVWGGQITAGGTYANSGAMYHPDSDLWEAMSASNVPGARAGHTAVWSGSEMIVWGGVSASGWLNTGGRFTPDQQTWRTISTNGAPAERSGHIAVWTGTNLFIWGGRNSYGLLNDGALYQPASNLWTTLTLPSPPAARNGAVAVWAGDRVLLWGGEGAAGVLSDGAQLLFSSGVPTAWAAMSTSNAPAARRNHTAVWTGQTMIVWGGDDGDTPIGDGAAFNPAANSWQTLSSTSAPAARSGHAAVWTGQEMLILAGSTGAAEFASGSAYDPATDGWRTLSATGSPQARTEAAAAWTGTEVLLFGGRTQSQYLSALQRLVPQPVWYFYRKL